ncbi:MAG TPA: Rieske 2Fe-2S domain-containing protein [Chloroflexota bacterium]|nr:Rieske 2Fe-2S domain-containing protein [Chloroflexota bacterium]
MLSREENERITRVGPGTPMGNLLRRYWMPVAMSTELPAPDCEPLEVKLLGEELVAFRDTAGQVGLLDRYCPHRRASMWLGRNEEHGLRCVFHGWKFDVEGRCVEMPSEPAVTDFKDKVRMTSYPTLEQGGVIWAYMGPPDLMPAPPNFEWTQVPDTHRSISKTWEECSWLQALEGGVDSAHSSFLHRALGGAVTRGGFSANGFRARAGNPDIEVRLADWGYTYASIRHLGEEGDYVRTYHYVLPFTQIRAQQFGANNEVSGGGTGAPVIAGHMWVPMDDENCMVYNWRYSFGTEPLANAAALESSSGRAPSDQDKNFRKIRNKDNRWLIDREVQRTLTFTGIEGVNTQDHAIQESMGPIVDRSKEHLGTIDRAIIALRRLLLDGMEINERGGDPPGSSPAYYRIRAIERLLPQNTAWWSALSDEILNAEESTEEARLARV